MSRKISLPIDENQRNIFRTNLGTSFTAEAGAGTGKTSLLVDRLIGLALHHGNSLARIVAITYTEKAAEELFDRIRQGLEVKLAASDSIGDIKKFSDILAEIETANISTIHGLASSLLHDRAIQAEIDPEFNHIEPKDENILFNDVILKSLKTPDKARDKWLSKFILLGGKLSSILDFSHDMYDKRHILNYQKLKISAVEDSTIIDIFDTTRQLFNFALSNCHNQTDKGFINIAEATQLLPLEYAGQPEILYNWLDHTASMRKNAGSQNNWDTKENLILFKKDFEIVKSRATELLAQFRRETIENILIWLKSTLSDVQRIKISQGKIGFSDQLSMTHKLLISPAIRSEIANRYQRLLIDEFQDTDPLQVEIALYLAAVHSLEKSVFDLQLEPGKLSVVGDPKQSIYRFRGADIDTYNQAARQILKTGNSIQIIQNFRSSKGVIEFINAFFTSNWNSIYPADDPYTEIAPDLNRPQPNPEPCVTVLSSKKINPDEKTKVDDLRFAEATAIAGVICRTQQDPFWTIVDPRSKRLRRVNTGDFALLFPTTTRIDIYTGVFDQYDIPFQIEGGKNFFRSQIATEFFSCLKAVDNPADRLSVIAALRSRFFAVNDRDIFLWQSDTNGAMDYRNTSTEISDKIKPALKILHKLNLLTSVTSVDQLINVFLEMTMAIPQISSFSNSWSEVSAIGRFREHAFSWSRENSCDFAGFCQHFNSMIEGGDDKGSGGTSTSTDAVKMMTIHAAKGLEFPIVALANFFGPKRTEKPPVISSYTKKQFEVRLGSKESGYFETAGYAKLLESDKQAQIQERLRLMYVAMTRSRDHLIIPKFVEYDKDGNTTGVYHKWLDKFLLNKNNISSNGTKLWGEVISDDDNKNEIIDSEKSIISILTNIDSAKVKDELANWRNDRSTRLQKAINRIPLRIVPSRETSGFDKEGFTQDVNRDSDIDAQSLGIAFHDYMAKCHLNKNIDMDFASRVASEHHVDNSKLIIFIENCLSSTIWQKIMRSKQVWREMPIVAMVNSVRIQGVVDIVFKDNSGRYHIVDYKTGVTKMEAYHTQLKLYADSVRAAIGEKKIASVQIYNASSDTTEIVESVE